MALNFPSNPSLNDTYSYGGKTWTFNGSAWIQTGTENPDITITGNITANTFIGDGSQLTGLPAGYTDSNVAEYLPTYTGNITAGNILTDNYFYANGDPFTSYTDADVDTLLSGNITVGNVTVTGVIDGYATTSYVDTEVANLINAAPSTLDTLNELATALGNDAAFSTTVTSLIGNNTSNIATIQSQITALEANTHANLESNVTTLEGNITTLEGNVTTLEGNVATLEGNITSIESNVTTLQGNVITIESQITALEANTHANLESNVTTLESQVANLNYYDNSNVATFLSDIGSNNVSTTGDITANSFIGDGSQLTGLPASYTDANVADYLPTYTGNLTAGNITVTGVIDGYATTTYVDTEVANLVNAAPSTLDTLNELATALGNDAAFSTTITALIGNNASNITTIQSQITALEANTHANLESNVTTLEGNITTIESDITTLQGNIITLESNVTTIESDITALQANTHANLESNVTTLESQIGNLNYYDDVNVTTFLSNIGSNDIVTTGNVTANYFLGNGSQLTGISASAVTTGNVAPTSPNDGDIWFDTDSAKQFTYIDDGDSAQWVETQADTTLNLGGGSVDLSAVDQNIVPAANVTYDLGSTTNRWRDIFLSNSTIYLGEANISAQGGTLTLPSAVSIGNSVLDSSSGNLTLPSTVAIGNVTIDASSGNLSLPEGSSIGGATVATPRIASIDYGGDDTAADPAGGQTIGIVGTGFASGATVYMDSAVISVVSFISSTRLEFTAPAKSTGSYSLYVINEDGGTAIYVPGVQYSGVPSWTSPSAGSLGSVYETGNVSQTFSANSDSTVSYSLNAGTLPPGTTLDANTGVLSGTANLTNGTTTTYNFTIRATDGENQDTDRAFSFTINTDAITWNSPTDGNVIQGYEFSAYSQSLDASSAASDGITYSASGLPANISLSGNTLSGDFGSAGNTSSTLTATANTTTRVGNIAVTFQSLEDVVSWSSPTDGNTISKVINTAASTTLDASSAAGYEIVYTSNTLPTGLSLSGNTISGTPTSVANTSVALTATANTSNRYTTITVTFAITLPLGDEYFNSTTLLLNADVDTFITDASDNAFDITPNGDTRPSAFSPYNGGWSNYFDGTGDYLRCDAALDGLTTTTSPFTISFWIYPLAAFNNEGIMIPIGINRASDGYNNLLWRGVDLNVNDVNQSDFSTIPQPNEWSFNEIIYDGSTINVYVNGSQVYTQSSVTFTAAFSDCVLGIGAEFDTANGGTPGNYFNGYIADFRIVTSALSPSSVPTSPLTAVSGTSLLTCQSNQLADNSPNNFAITRNGDVKVTSFGPFSTDYRPAPDSYSVAFDRNGDYLSLASNAAFGFGTGDFTIECWVYHPGAFANDEGWVSIVTPSGYSYPYFRQGYLIWNNNGSWVNFFVVPTDQWCHIVMQRSGTTVSAYLNGVKATSTQTVNTNLGSSSILTIGDINYSGTPANLPFLGLISNLRVVKGQAVYSSNFVPSTAPFTTTSQGVTASNISLLTCQDSTLIDNSSNGHTITSNGQAHPVTANPFDGSPITYSGYFDGSGDFIYATVSAAGAGSFTYEAWVYPQAFASNKTIFRTDSSGNLDISLLCNASGQLLSYDNNGTLLGSTTSTLSLNTWSHVALVRNGTNIEIYINGNASRTGGSGSFSTNITFTKLDIGGRASDGGESWNGYISNARYAKAAIYTSAFTPSTTPLTTTSQSATNVELLTCQSPGFIDNSSNAFAITVGGSSVIKTNNPFGYNEITQTAITDITGSGYFDGSSSLNLASNALWNFDGDFTVECWAYLTSFTDNRLIAVTTTNGFALYVNGSGYPLIDRYAVGALITSNTAISLNSWNHIAAVRSGSSMALYLNGSSVGTTQSLHNFVQGALYIATDNAGRFHNGYISNVRIVKGTALYTSSFLPPATSLTSVTNTSLLTLQNRIGYGNKQPIDESGVKNVITNVSGSNAAVGSFSPHVPSGWSAYFDGNTDFLSVPTTTSSDLNLYNTEWTIETWFYCTATPAANAICLIQSQQGTNNWVPYVSIFLNTNLTVGAHINAGQYSASQTFSLNAWNHIALSRNSSGTVTLYLNGAATSLTGSYNIDNVDLSFWFGKVDNAPGGGGYTYYYTGYISNARILKGTEINYSSTPVPTAPLEPITNTSLLTLRGPSFTDDGPNRFAITRNGDTKITPFSPFKSHTITPDSYSVYFDGTGDYLSIPRNSAFLPGASTDFTMEAWVYPISIGAQGASILNMGEYGDYNNTDWGWAVSSTGTVTFYLATSNVVRATTGTVNFNAWNHIAVARSGTGSNNLTIYVNGTGESFTETGAFTHSASATQLTIGADNNGDEATLNGYLSDVRMINGSAIYSGASITVPTAPLTAITNTVLLTCQSPTVIDNSTNGFAITVNANSQPTKFNPFGETVTTGVEYSPVSHGGSVYFDGSGDYLSIGNTQLLTGTSDYTIEGWAYLTSLYNYQAIFYSQNSGATGMIAVAVGSGGALDHAYYTGSAYPKATINGVKINEWFHFAAVRKSNVWSIFLNGVKGTDATITNSVGSADPRIGNNPATGNERLTGWVSNFRITKTALYTSNFVPPASPVTSTASSILLTCNNNAAIQDKTGRNVLETVGNARVLNGVKKYGSGAMYFDGTGDYLTVYPAGNTNFDFGSGDFTVECWFYANSLSASSYAALMGFHDGNTSAWAVYVRSNGVFFYGSAATLTGAGTVNTSTWYHFAASRSGSTIRVFLDGTQVDSDTVSGTYTTGGVFFRVGEDNAGSNPAFNGYIDDLRITKGVARYTANFTPPSDAFTAK